MGKCAGHLNSIFTTPGFLVDRGNYGAQCNSVEETSGGNNNYDMYKYVPCPQPVHSEGVLGWIGSGCENGASVDHLSVCSITPEFGYECTSPGECYAESFDEAAECVTYECTTPATEVRTTKHGKTWSKNDAYVVTETDMRAADRYWDVTAVCAEGYVGTAVVGVCTGGRDSEYFLSGCNLDTDRDGHADDDEDCENDPNKTSCGECGCGQVDFDSETGHVNCATTPGVGLLDAHNQPFYNLDVKQWVDTEGEFNRNAGECHSLSVAHWDEVNDFGDLAGAYAFSSKGTVGEVSTLVAPLSKTTLAFQAGVGSGQTISLVTEAEDGTFTRVRKQYTVDHEEVRQVFWDVSGMQEELAKLVISDEHHEGRVYVNNIRLFDSEQGCLPECISIYEDTLGKFHFNGDQYYYVSVNPLKEGKNLFCRDTWNGDLSIGESLGTDISTGFPDAITTKNLDVPRLPSCLMVEKKGSAYALSVERDAMQFAFSNTHHDLDDESLYCVYPTKQPRCIDYYGLLMDSTRADMFCVPQSPKPMCLETAIKTKCTDGTLCGDDKITRDLLSCCDKDGNSAGGGCLARRRLGESLQVSEDTVLDADKAEECARKCMDQPDDNPCVAWRLAEDESCVITTQCLNKDHRLVDLMELTKESWQLATPETDPYAGLKVRVKKSIVN